MAWSLMLQGWFPLSSQRVPRIGQLSALSVVIAIGFYSTTPIFFEAAVEASHPLPQGSVIMLMTFIFNAFSIIILAVPAQSRCRCCCFAAAAAAAVTAVVPFVRARV